MGKLAAIHGKAVTSSSFSGAQALLRSSGGETAFLSHMVR
jgi:hypothetical protein